MVIDGATNNFFFEFTQFRLYRKGVNENGET